MRCIMKKLVFCLLALLPLLSACVNVVKILDENNANYHFRETRWGFSLERVELSEAGHRPFQKTKNELVYRYRINGIYCKVVYTFKNNKLRTAGYLTDQPVQNADILLAEAVKRHGMPIGDVPEKREEGLVWVNPDTVVYANVYTTITKKNLAQYEYSKGGLLEDLLANQLADQSEAGEVVYLDGVFAYVDRAFYEQLHEIKFPLTELSIYEKQLMGVIKRQQRKIYPGFGTFPDTD